MLKTTHARVTHNTGIKLFSFLFILAIALLLFTTPARAEGFASTPLQSIYPLETYEYTVVPDTNWANLSMSTTADWLVIDNDTVVMGIPSAEDIGSYRVNLTLTNDTATVYQNYTLSVLPRSTIDTNYLVLGLVFGFGLVVMGFVDHRWNFLGGIIWIYFALAVFLPFGIPWAFIGVGFGLILMLDGAVHISDD